MIIYDFEKVEKEATFYALASIGRVGYHALYPQSDQTFGEICEEDYIAGAKFGINFLLDQLANELPNKLGNSISTDDLADFLLGGKFNL